MVDTGDQSIGLSIGALSNATGVPVETLRTWERRYGFPSPIDRTEGRHRRYSASTVDEVRLALQALDLGHRPSAVLGRSPAQVRELIGAVLLVGTEAAFQPPSSSPQDERIVESWLELTRQSEGERLSHEFSRSMAEIGALEFLERRMGCYLRRVGDAWAAGELRVMHEHLASERAREFLAAQWRTLSERAARPNAPAVVMATPSGERHVLGLLPDYIPGLQTATFHAALEAKWEQLALWLMAWMTRVRIVRNWGRWVPAFQWASDRLINLGSDVGGMHIMLAGKDLDGRPASVTWNLTARRNHGPEIPCAPALILARKLAAGALAIRGAFPCLGLFSLQDFRTEVSDLDIEWVVERRDGR
jgi:hypothetical protein